VDDAQELSQRLSVVLEEIKDIMNARKQRVQELRDQIAVMENENEDLERRINELIMDAF
jgi:TolA-binding protein